QGNIFTEKEFDEDGRVKRITNPFRLNEVKKWTTNVYDESSRIKEVILPDGSKVKTDYGVLISDFVGVSKTITDQAGKKRKGISDALGRMIRVIEDPDGQNLKTDYVFDTLGNLRNTIQGEQNRYFTYDSLGRLLFAKQPEQESNANFNHTDPITNNSVWSVKYEYDDNGNITKTTDARGVFVKGIYDNFNRLKTRDYSDSTPDVSLYYDGRGLGSIPAFSKGKVTRVVSSVSESRYTNFDNLGRLLASQQITDGQTYNFKYQYNLTSLVAETYPSGKVVNYEFNTDGELSRVSGQTVNNSKTYANSFNYNSSGGVESFRLGNGKWETAKYNNRLQITQIGLGNSSADTSLLKINYDYGTSAQNNGSIREQRINFAGLSSEIKQSYTYDDLNRLKSATETFNNGTQSWKQTFNYDRYGNRTFDPNNTSTLNQSQSWKATNPTIQTADNRLKKDQDNDNINDYDYDKTGNVRLDAENKRFVYDAENRLKEFFKGTNNSETPDATYSYDGNGKRVKKISASEIVVFVYNADGTLAAEYSTTPPEDAKVSYLTADHLGSPRIITDEAGMVVSRHDYLSFGDEITTTLGNIAGRTAAQHYGAEDEIRKQYTGYERDEESGLDYAQARYYNSQHGRFTSIDPLIASANIKDPQTFNRYSYAMNSPYKFTDPLGLISQNSGSACGQWCSNSIGGGFNGGAEFDSLDGRGYSGPQKQTAQQSEAPPTTEAEQNQDDPISEASNKTDDVQWKSGNTVIAQGTVELTNEMVKTLGDNAAEFENIDQQKTKMYSEIITSINSLEKEGYSGSFLSSTNGKLKITLTNPDGISFSGGVSEGGASSGASISKNEKITNVLDLVKDYNDFVQKRNDLYTQRKTEFQNKFDGTTLKITSSTFFTKSKLLPHKQSQLGNKARRAYLGDLYYSRMGAIAGQ
ncbi:MAG: RHS repeat-associated core domain-containing protein, partial [Pyrinomonadaceae bacterium]